MFRDRHHAGRLLAERLRTRLVGDTVVLALPRGGVPVAFEVARALGAPLDVFVVRKLGAPGEEELAMGAIATGGVRILNDEVIDALGISAEQIDAVTAQETAELTRRERLYRGGLPPTRVTGRTAVLIDDGLATGASMRAAIEAVRQLAPARIVVAVPTSPPEVCHSLEQEVDDLICLYAPDLFYAVGIWYHDFPQVTDAEVRALLAEARTVISAPQPMA